MTEIVEIGIKLYKELAYYQEILNKAGAVNTFNCEIIIYIGQIKILKE